MKKLRFFGLLAAIALLAFGLALGCDSSTPEPDEPGTPAYVARYTLDDGRLGLNFSQDPSRLRATSGGPQTGDSYVFFVIATDDVLSEGTAEVGNNGVTLNPDTTKYPDQAPFTAELSSDGGITLLGAPDGAGGTIPGTVSGGKEGYQGGGGSGNQGGGGNIGGGSNPGQNNNGGNNGTPDLTKFSYTVEKQGGDTWGTSTTTGLIFKFYKGDNWEVFELKPEYIVVKDKANNNVNFEPVLVAAAASGGNKTTGGVGSQWTVTLVGDYTPGEATIYIQHTDVNKGNDKLILDDDEGVTYTIVVYSEGADSDSTGDVSNLIFTFDKEFTQAAWDSGYTLSIVPDTSGSPSRPGSATYSSGTRNATLSTTGHTAIVSNLSNVVDGNAIVTITGPSVDPNPKSIVLRNSASEPAGLVVAPILSATQKVNEYFKVSVTAIDTASVTPGVSKPVVALNGQRSVRLTLEASPGYTSASGSTVAGTFGSYKLTETGSDVAITSTDPKVFNLPFTNGEAEFYLRLYNADSDVKFDVHDGTNYDGLTETVAVMLGAGAAVIPEFVLGPQNVAIPALAGETGETLTTGSWLTSGSGGPVAVRLLDAYGNPVTTATTGNITLSLLSASGVTPSGHQKATGADGIAVFSDLKLVNAGEKISTARMVADFNGTKSASSAIFIIPGKLAPAPTITITATRLAVLAAVASPGNSILTATVTAAGTSETDFAYLWQSNTGASSAFEDIGAGGYNTKELTVTGAVNTAATSATGASYAPGKVTFRVKVTNNDTRYTPRTFITTTQNKEITFAATPTTAATAPTFGSISLSGTGLNWDDEATTATDGTALVRDDATGPFTISLTVTGTGADTLKYDWQQGAASGSTASITGASSGVTGLGTSSITLTTAAFTTGGVFNGKLAGTDVIYIKCIVTNVSGGYIDGALTVYFKVTFGDDS